MGCQIIVGRLENFRIQRNIDPSCTKPKINLYFTNTTMHVFVWVMPLHVRQDEIPLQKSTILVLLKRVIALHSETYK
jgi:hypothetical protein